MRGRVSQVEQAIESQVQSIFEQVRLMLRNYTVNLYIYSIRIDYTKCILKLHFTVKTIFVHLTHVSISYFDYRRKHIKAICLLID